MIKRIIKMGVIALAVVFVAIQFSRPDFENPPVKQGESLEDIYDVPVGVKRILKRSCADCHSNETVYPWYSKIAPVSWGMHDHIRLGREEMNFSIWATYSDKKRARKLEEICEEVREGGMPYYQYLWLHAEAVVTPEQKDQLCKWTSAPVKR